jgi:hypothetical protein
MKSALLLIAGVAIGFVVAHEVSKTDYGRKFFDDVDGKAKEFGDAVVAGYRSREAELKTAVSNAQDAIDDLAKRAKS